ncbi:MAG: hypothetical protein JWL58_6085, partial [Streptosporangiaceae bacterium]|nr:hypothetical protein [Streptosporangiaceae bacterium]
MPLQMTGAPDELGLLGLPWNIPLREWPEQPGTLLDDGSGRCETRPEAAI